MTNAFTAWAALIKEKWLLQDVVYLLAASIHIQSYVSLKGGGGLSHCLYTLFGQLHVDFFFAIS